MQRDKKWIPVENKCGVVGCAYYSIPIGNQYCSGHAFRKTWRYLILLSKLV